MSKKIISNIVNFEQLLTEKIPEMIPNGYEIENNRLYRTLDDDKKKFVCDYVPHIETIYFNERDNQTFWTLRWVEPDGEVKRLKLIPKGTFATTSRIIDLYEKGFSVTSDNANELVKYFQRYEITFKGEIEKKFAYDQLGYTKDGFLLPNQFISSDSRQDIVFQADGGNADYIKGFEEKGTLEEWITNVFEPIKSKKIPLAYTLASIGSPLLNVFNIPAFMVDVSFITSSGKSVTMKVACSVWGSWKLHDTWLGTYAGIERRAVMLNHLPYLIDDTKNTKFRPDELATMIYTLASGQEKTRSGIKNNHISRTWNNVILSTGERKITEFSNDGGTVARVLAIHGRPIEHNEELINEIEEATEDYYGISGTTFLKWFVNLDSEQITNYKTILQGYKTHYSNQANNPIIKRTAKYMAFIRLISDMVQDAFGIEIDSGLLDELWFEIVEDNQQEQADRPLQALREVMELASRNRGKFYEKSEDKVFPIDNSFGEHHKDTKMLCFERTFLKDYLQKRGFDPNTIFKQWKERKFLKTREKETSSAMAVTSVYTKKTKRFYCIDLTHKVLREEEE